MQGSVVDSFFPIEVNRETREAASRQTEDGLTDSLGREVEITCSPTHLFPFSVLLAPIPKQKHLPGLEGTV